MTREQIEDLERLDPDRFEERKHTALSWVRAFLTCKDGVPVELDLEFASVLPPRERRHVITAMKGMFFFNLLSNTWSVWARKALRLSPKETGQVCVLETGTC